MDGWSSKMKEMGGLMIPSWDDECVWWWEDAGRKMVVAAVTQAENARAWLGEDAGEVFRTDGDVGGWWIRWMLGGREDKDEDERGNKWEDGRGRGESRLKVS